MQGDWFCGRCQYLNFSWRTKCQRCDMSYVGLSNAHRARSCNLKPGDWFCDAGFCQTHNYANRRFCFKCGAPKPKSSSLFGYCTPPMVFGFLDQRVAKVSRKGWRTGDWFCGRPDCIAHNFGDRVQCFKCNSSRELVSETCPTDLVASQGSGKDLL